MARVLVRWVDKPDNVGLTPNRKQFDPVVVVPDAWVFGSREGYPTYMVFDFPGLDHNDLRFLTEPLLDPNGPFDNYGKSTKIAKRSGWAFAWQTLSTPIKNAITAAYEANEPYTVNATLEQVINYFEKKVL